MVGNDQAKGALQNLQRLEILANTVCEEEGQKIKEIDEVNQMKERVRELKEKRDRLNKQLKYGPKQVLHQVLKKRSQGKVKGQKDSIVQALRSAQKRKQEELCHAYRLTGISVTAVQDNRIRICFDSFYSEEYHEPYYMELDIKDQRVVSIYRHTLPYFIPLQKLIDHKLNENTKDFLQTISGYLTAYVARRQQAVNTQEKFGELFTGELLSSSAFDYVEFNLGASDSLPSAVDVKLVYDDLVAPLPTRVSVDVQGDCPRRLRTKLKNLKDSFKSEPLPNVLSDM
ncbi:centromere protein O-like [Glandiceps talaboti]